MREIRRTLLVGLALLAAVNAARAQTPDQPNLILTISGGWLTGGDLWSVGRQPAPVQTSAGFTWDTLALARRMRPGFAATLTATYFRTPYLGWTAEVGFFGIGTEARCAPVVPFKTDPDAKNTQACQYLQGENLRGSAAGFLGGVILRATRGGPQPFVRVAAGPAILGSSFVEMAAPVLVQGIDAATHLPTLSRGTLFLMTEKSRRSVSWMLSVGVGAMLPLGPGYQLRFEARDIIVPLPIATGAAPPDTTGEHPPYAPVGTRIMHVPTITVGLDVVLEKKRGRRY
jgi:hypothetical protein